MQTSDNEECYYYYYCCYAADVIDSCSQASSVLERFEVIVLHKPPSTVSDPAAAASATPPPIPVSTVQQEALSLPHEAGDLLLPDPQHDLLTHDLLQLGIGGGAEMPTSNPQSVPSASVIESASNVDLLNDLLSGSPTPLVSDQQTDTPLTASTSQLGSSLLPVQAIQPLPTNGVVQNDYRKLSQPEKQQKLPAALTFKELDIAGRQLLGFAP